MQPDQPIDPAVRDLLYQIKFGTTAQRNEAIDSAPLLGARAISHLARVMAAWNTPGQYRGAHEAIKRIVLNGYRAGGEQPAITAELIRLIGRDQSERVRREALYLLGFAGSAESVAAVAPLLDDPILREDARMALERISARDAESAIRAAHRRADGPWRAALDYSLRRRRTSLRDVGTRR